MERERDRGHIQSSVFPSHIAVIAPLPSLQVIQDPLVAAVLDQAMAGQSCMVWGSSLGWIVFYSALIFGWSSVGYELLSCLSEQANKLLELDLGPLPGTGEHISGLVAQCIELVSARVSMSPP